MRNIGIVLSYDGTQYFGFQTQPNRNTIQDKLEEAIQKLSGQNVKLHSSGRTDAGVHARRQFVNFQIDSVIPIQRWCMALNAVLPQDIVVLEAHEMPIEFHARKSAKRKTYRYTINFGKFPDLFQRNYQFHHPRSLDVQAMREALHVLIGEHDFTSFCSIKTTKESKIRIIYEAKIELPSPEVVQVFITGNGFLHNMVRIIIGTLIKIGQGNKRYTDMYGILMAKDRSRAGPTAESHGLMLWDVYY